MKKEINRSQRVKRLKKMILWTIALAILIPVIGCILLSVRVFQLKKQVAVLTEQLPTEEMQEEASGVYETTKVEESVRDTETKAEEPAKINPVKSSGKKVYLTFDDGPSNNTEEILDILNKYDVKATFFVVGNTSEHGQEVLRRIVSEGHSVGLHSYSHKYKEIYQSVETYAADLTKLQNFLYQTTGVRCKFCRFPGGSSNTVSEVDMHDLITYLDEKEIAYFDWNVSSGDAASSYISPEDIVKNCTDKLENYQETIILMHDAKNKNSTVEALPELIETIQAMDKTRIVPITEETEPIHHISND